MTKAVEIKELSKTYRTRGQADKKALHTISLDIEHGTVFGLLGPNGAGKSTLINIMAGLTLRTSGSMQICGFDIDQATRAARRSIGVVPQELNIDPFFSPRDAVELQAGLFGVRAKDRRTDEILARVGLTEQADHTARSLSGGMRRRLMVAKAMAHHPRVLVLDEPTAGVDVELRRQLWDQIRILNQKGTTILLTTHYLEEAESLCDYIAIIHHGGIVALDRTRDLIGRLDHRELLITPAVYLTAIPEQLRNLDAQLSPDGELVIRYQSRQTPVAQLLATVHEADIEVSDLKTREPDLEDVFIELTRNIS